MTENGDPLENPIAERINRTIKEEFTEQRYLSFRNISEGKEKIRMLGLDAWDKLDPSDKAKLETE